jgi:hypothetical protein
MRRESRRKISSAIQDDISVKRSQQVVHEVHDVHDMMYMMLSFTSRAAYTHTHTYIYIRQSESTHLPSLAP